MRYYAIQIFTKDKGDVLVTDPVTGQFQPSAPAPPVSLLPNAPPPPVINNGQPQSTYTSYVNGKTLPGALNIEFNIPILGFAEPGISSWLRIWGIPLAQIGFVRDLTNLPIVISAGMKAGLPLAKPEQSGVILTGVIKQAFANWVGTDQTLELMFYPDVGSNDNPKNIVLNWTAGMPLQQALQSTLRIAFPNFTQVFAISPNLVLNYNEVHFVATLNQLAQWLKQRTQPIIGGSYAGVDIILKDNTLTIFDGTMPIGKTTVDKPKHIAFEDMIGQPTWIKPAQIQFQTVLRYDIGIGDIIKLPPGIASPFAIVPTGQLTLPNTPARNKNTFNGPFKIRHLWHYGNYRQPDGASWVTVFNANYVQQSPALGDFPSAFANVG